MNKQKIILIDAYHCLFNEDGISNELLDILESYPNKKIVLTNADDEQMVKFGINKSPYEVFTLKHDPNKTDDGYYKKMLEYFQMKPSECIYIEHDIKAILKSRESGIESFHYQKDLKKVKEFISQSRHLNYKYMWKEKLLAVLGFLAYLIYNFINN